jgi:hypothetical protein
MNEPANKRYLILSQDPLIGSLATVYTPLRSWLSHKPMTPEGEKRARELNNLFNEGLFIDVWSKLPLLIIYNKSPIPKGRPGFIFGKNYGIAFENASYQIFKVNAQN